jgi:hypothetical protein
VVKVVLADGIAAAAAAAVSSVVAVATTRAVAAVLALLAQPVPLQLPIPKASALEMVKL